MNEGQDILFVYYFLLRAGKRGIMGFYQEPTIFRPEQTTNSSIKQLFWQPY